MQVPELFFLLLVVPSILAVPVPARVRFPNDRIDDERSGRILLPPFEPTREELVRTRANPIASFIPKEPLPLAEPDQSLNAWQFYFPPGPPPTEQSVSGEDLLDTAGSAALPAISTPKSTEEEFGEEDNTTDETEVAATTVEPLTEKPLQTKIKAISKSLLAPAVPSSPPNFSPQFEDGGWSPIAINL